MWFSAQNSVYTVYLGSGEWSGEGYYGPLIATHNTSFRLVPRSMTLNGILKVISAMLSFPRPISRKLKLLIRNHTTTFRWYDCRWPWRYCKVIRLFNIKFLVNGAWYGKSYYRLLTGNHTLAFDWCHFWWPWRTSESHFSLDCHFHDQYLRSENYTRCVHS